MNANFELETLVNILSEEIEIEKENLKECSDKNSRMAGMIIGTLDAYQNILLIIKDLK